MPRDSGKPERGDARVHAEHAGIEHLFSLCDARHSVKHLRGYVRPLAEIRIGASIEAPAIWQDRAVLVTARDGTLRALTVGGRDL